MSNMLMHLFGLKILVSYSRGKTKSYRNFSLSEFRLRDAKGKSRPSKHSDWTNRMYFGLWLAGKQDLWQSVCMYTSAHEKFQKHQNKQPVRFGHVFIFLYFMTVTKRHNFVRTVIRVDTAKTQYVVSFSI